MSFYDRPAPLKIASVAAAGLLCIGLAACSSKTESTAGSTSSRAASSSSAAAGGVSSLDKTFGKDGVLDLSLGAGDDATKAMVVGPDGKILLAGSSVSTDAAGKKSANMIIARVGENGSLDGGFGAGNSDGTPDGVVSLSLGDGDDVANGIAVQKDGKAVVVGTSTSQGGTKNLEVVRLNADGTPDTSFGKGNEDGTPDGFVNLSLSDGDDVANAVAIEPDGKIVVAGSTSSADGSNIAVARMNADGSLDKTFGVGTTDGSPDGVVTLNLGKGDDAAQAVAVEPDGKIVVAGNSTSTGTDGSKNIVVARMNADGTTDTTFGQANDGTPDGVFNLSLSDGDDVADALAVAGDGSVVVVGTSAGADGKNLAVARLAADGSLDKAFGKDGKDGTPEGVVGLSLGKGDDQGAAVAVEPDGKVVVAGSTTSVGGGSSNVFVARMLADGALDPTFGTAKDETPDGVVNLSFGDGDDTAAAVAVSGGKVLVAGTSKQGDSTDMVVARIAG